MSFRNVCFTINNYTEEDCKRLDEIECKYIVYGREIGEQGTPHLQGYVELNNQLRIGGVKLLLGTRAHIESRKGSAEQADEYCKKDGKYVSRGNRSSQGRRTDLEQLVQMVKAGKSDKQISEELPNVLKYTRAIDFVRNSFLEERTTKPEVHWRWGKAGVGKTRYVMELPGTKYIKDNTHWWTRKYNQQDIILIDDFNGKWEFTDLMRLFDHNPYEGQTKGGYVNINSPKIYVTSEHHPRDYYGGGNIEAQLMRRLTSVTEVGVTEVAGNTMQPPSLGNENVTSRNPLEIVNEK